MGNLIDRAFRGFVVDMFNVLFMNFAVFNVADICGVKISMAVTSGSFSTAGYRRQKSTGCGIPRPGGRRFAGAAFSIFSEHTWALALVSLVMSVALALALWKGLFKHPRSSRINRSQLR